MRALVVFVLLSAALPAQHVAPFSVWDWFPGCCARSHVELPYRPPMPPPPPPPVGPMYYTGCSWKHEADSDRPTGGGALLGVGPTRPGVVVIRGGGVVLSHGERLPWGERGQALDVSLRIDGSPMPEGVEWRLFIVSEQALPSGEALDELARSIVGQMQ